MKNFTCGENKTKTTRRSIFLKCDDKNKSFGNHEKPLMKKNPKHSPCFLFSVQTGFFYFIIFLNTQTTDILGSVRTSANQRRRVYGHKWEKMAPSPPSRRRTALKAASCLSERYTRRNTEEPGFPRSCLLAGGAERGGGPSWHSFTSLDSFKLQSITGGKEGAAARRGFTRVRERTPSPARTDQITSSSAPQTQLSALFFFYFPVT